MKHLSRPSSRTLKVALLAVVATIVVVGTAAEDRFNILVRKKNGRATIVSMPLKGLKDPGFFETEDFKIVEKKGDAPISTRDASPRLVLRAANTLYHAKKAKNFFIERIKSAEVEKLEQILIRLEITNQFSELGHFMHDNRDPQFNNARSVPAGKGIRDTKPWGREIWFHPKKEIPVKELLAEMPEDPFNPTIRQVNELLLPSQVDVGIRNLLSFAFSPEGLGSAYLKTTTRQAGTLLLIEGALQVSKLVNRIMIPNRYYVDTAMVPEIIYHEFTHIALSDYLIPSHSTAVIEGIAEYFAAVISGSPKLVDKIRKYSTAQSKNAKKKKTFDISLEKSENAHSDFVLAMLWGMRDLLGEEMATDVIFEARKHLSTRDSDIRSGLTEALVAACRDVCRNPDADRLRLYQYFGSLGL